MPLKVIGTWDGGFIRETSRGKVYVIRRSIGGKRYDVSTGCSTSTGAAEQLKRFESDPESYEPGGATGAEALVLDDALIDLFLRFSRDEKKNSPRWVAQQRLALLWWVDQIGGK